MTKHSFNPDFAAEYGIKEAIVYQYISDSCKGEATPDTHQHDGRFWLEFPRNRFGEVFPYMNEATVYNIVRKLQRLELLDSACFTTYPKMVRSYSPRADTPFYEE